MRARPVYFIQLGWLGFKEGEGELKLRLKIGYHNSLGVSQSLDMLESTSGFRTVKLPVFYSRNLQLRGYSHFRFCSTG